MTNFNTFRPTLNDLEGRSLMSATLAAAAPAPQAAYLRVELENVFVSSATPAPAAADHKETIEIASWSLGASNPTAARGGMSAGKVSYSDLSVMAHGAQGYYEIVLEDVIVSDVRVDDAAGLAKVGPGTLTFPQSGEFVRDTYKQLLGREASASGSHALYQDVTIPANTAKGHEGSKGWIELTSQQ